ncbi:barstar family protein [Actinomadura sp. 3N407]|uniref:barstar family protein n=1 Tax=Actinomadura sp. 3N407 TaxID=3457423 RepID=UPI003FCDF578
MFVDLPPRPREQFTLVGCRPEGALADLLERVPVEELGTERAWLGDLYLAGPEPAPGTPPSWWGEDVGDLVVLAHQPSKALPGTVDIDFDGFVHVYDRTEAVERPGDATEFFLQSRDGAPYGKCLDVRGVFREQSAPPVPNIRLLGCKPEPPLLAALAAAGPQSDAARRGRRIIADVYAVTADGSVGRVTEAAVYGMVEAGEPSRLGAGLLDVTIASEPREPLPTGVLDILEHWHRGRPTDKNLWADYDRTLRHYWAGMALTRRSREPDSPAGGTYDLDGRFVTDIEGFYCAIGEAINGPGGYFGWNLDALDDCFSGGFGAQIPFRIVWHTSSVARTHLVPGYDKRRLGPAVTFDYLQDMLTEHHIEIDLR